MTPEALRQLSQESRQEKAFFLAQFAFFLQMAYNREQATARMAEEAVKKLLAKSVSKYPGATFDERRQLAVVSEDKAREWESRRIDALLKLDRLAFLVNRVDEVRKCLQNVSLPLARS